MKRPPCWPEGKPCPNSCAQALYDRKVYNRHHLPSPWDGWRFAGRVLVSPEGDRIAPERLRGILWREASEKRRSGPASVKKRVCEVANGLADRVRLLSTGRKDQTAGDG